MNGNIIETLMFYFEFPFVRYALIAGVLIALCSSLLGVTLVLKRFSFIGDGLSHVAFGAMAIATLFSVDNDMLIVMPITIVSAILLLRGSESRKVRGDAALAMISVGALALGYLLLNVFSTSANLTGDVCSTLFGSTAILTLRVDEVWLCVAMSVIVVGVFLFFYNKVFAITFDESFARATGTKTELYNLAVAIVTAVIIVLAMNLVGSLLTSALIVFPALSAMRVFKSYKNVIICSAILSVVCAVMGILISIIASTPVGSTIVAVDIVGFFAFSLIGKIR
ncbi:MAG: metal ABC transporter permease [Clostridia bacterium]|nr:metal ABC transporter permease [Clostridia bacterium]